MKRDRVKSWNQTQKMNYLDKEGIDILEAVKKFFNTKISKKELKEQDKIEKFKKFKEVLKKRD